MKNQQSQTIRLQQTINPQQNLREVIIESPLRQELLINTNYLSIQQKLSQDLRKLYESDFYQSINIHYGAKSKLNNTNAQEQLYRRKKQILELQIQTQKQCGKRMLQARSQEQILSIEQEYMKNLNLIQERKNYFNEDQFVPWIYVDAKKKRPVYGKIFHEFDRKGAAMLKSTIGYRSPFSLFDKIEFNMETLPREYIKKRQYYMFGLNWMKPFTYNKEDYDVFVSAQASCSPIFKFIDEKKVSSTLGFVKGENRIELQIAKRYPRFFDKIHQYCDEQMFYSSIKTSIKGDKTFKDTIERGDIMTGEYINTKGESTLPFLSQSKFMKVEFNYRKFFDLYNLGQKFQNQKLKLLFRNSNIQSNFSVKAMGSLSKHISDFYEKFEIRGFENQRNPSNSVCQIKSSLKFNNYNFPLFGKIGITPFLYAQGGLSIPKQWRKTHALGSLGLGLSYPLTKFIQLQLLYNLMQAQNHPARETVNFQIRIGFND